MCFLLLLHADTIDPTYIPRPPRKPKSNHDSESLGADRKDSLSEEQLGKRQDNAWRARLAFRRLVASNLSRTQPPLLITLTYKENITDIVLGYEDYRSFVQALRYKYGKNFKYTCVPEFQKRGAVHFHALFWGLPSEVLLQERDTRTIARIWGKGFVYIKQTDGDGRLSSYLAKYMSKAFIDKRLKNKKAYVASRNVDRPVVVKGFSPIWPVLDDYVGDNNPPVSERKYDTKWLGTCRHRLFKIPLDTDQ
jgi:hypothetical protein